MNLSRSSVVLFDLDQLKQTISELEAEQNKEGFWSDQNSALAVVARLNDAKNKVESYTSIKKEYDDLVELLDSDDGSDPEMAELIGSTEDELSTRIHELRNLLLFSGEYDALNCTLEVHPGAGGTEAQDWSDMLLRMTFPIYPAYDHASTKKRIQEACTTISVELEERLKQFKSQGKLLEAERLEMRTRQDMESLLEFGRCPGIENYSRHIDKRQPGQRPWTLVDYFPKDFLLLVDESHVTFPQLRGMAKMLLAKDCNVTVLHSKTSNADLRFYLKHADLVVVAIGHEGFIDASYEFKPSAWVVDVGINRGEDGHLHAFGINKSLSHVDFMIGTRDLSIVGTDDKGKEIPLFKNGTWAF